MTTDEAITYALTAEDRVQRDAHTPLVEVGGPLG